MNKESGVNRRGFLKSSLLGTAGVVVGSAGFGNTVNKVNHGKKIILRKLGKTEIELPVVSFGVMRSDNAALIKSAYEMGFKHFDTAHDYMEGRNEKMLGEVCKEIPRESLVISTKVFPDDMDRRTGKLGQGATKENMISKFELGLERLQMKYVDILYFHGVSSAEAAFDPRMLEAFKEIKNKGQARYIGMSTHMNQPEVIQAATDSNFYDVVLTSINFKQANVDVLKEKIALAAGKGIGIVAMKTMAGGFMDRERQRPINCSAALKWVLQDKNVTTSIPGIVAFDQLIQNFSVMENLELTDKEKADLDEARLVAGLYCDNCRACLTQCKKQLPVNEYMRAYMYTFGYRNYENAFTVLNDIDNQSYPCSDCTDCAVRCSMGFHVSERITDVSRLNSVPRDLLV